MSPLGARSLFQQDGKTMATYLRGIVGAGLIALGGAGGAIIAINLHTSSPRLMAAGIISAVIGIVGGGITMGRG